MCPDTINLGSQQKIHGIALETPHPLFKLCLEGLPGHRHFCPEMVWRKERITWSLHRPAFVPNLDTWLIPPPSTVAGISGLLGTFCCVLCCSPSSGLKDCLLASVHSPFSDNWLTLLVYQWTPPHIFSWLWIYYQHFILVLLCLWSIRKEKRGMLMFSL